MTKTVPRGDRRTQCANLSIGRAHRSKILVAHAPHSWGSASCIRIHTEVYHAVDRAFTWLIECLEILVARGNSGRTLPVLMFGLAAIGILARVVLPDFTPVFGMKHSGIPLVKRRPVSVSELAFQYE